MPLTLDTYLFINNVNQILKNKLRRIYMANFYDELDLRYPEIAICIEKIDRCNPGTKKFIIPILTPNLDINKERKETIHQNNSFIDNLDSISIKNIEIKNYIEIAIPPELCYYAGTTQLFNISNANMSASLNGTHNISGSGTVGPPHDYDRLSVSGNINMELNGTESINGNIHLVPQDSDRYIEKGSKWIVVFIGGDIGKPQIISRYMDSNNG